MEDTKLIYKSEKKLQNGVRLNITATVIFEPKEKQTAERKQAIKELKESLFDFEMHISEMKL